MPDIAIVNIDKREVLDSVQTGHGYKMKEAIGNRMPLDFMWLFAHPVDGQAAPPPSSVVAQPWYGSPASRVPIGHWAGDRVLIVDEYCGTASGNLPQDLIHAYPAADPQDDVLQFALSQLKHVDMPGYERAEDDKLFPSDRIWIVRNHTEKWFARDDALVNAKHRKGPDVGTGFGLGDFIWSQIGGGMNGNECIGHRFDVTTLDKAKDKEEWKDESAKATGWLYEFRMENDDVVDCYDY
ncbi:F-box domain-containing protein [Favolaschia claudopus]|uniref:F-box domain-containing protein n=1 Tax=Favolaschia claudopus TaxID=2862362 RepID=A0AAV9ZI40_9AGAR